MSKVKTYISLFSSAGVGCYGFKQNNFECIATNELLKKRMDIQRYNNKCKYESGYIVGDITNENVKEKLYEQIELWKKIEKISKVDVVIATPPCQGMSVANQKKSDDEIVRNSLVVESIKIIKQIKPNFFIFENVPSFMKTVCTDLDGIDKTISDAIHINLSSSYSYVHKVINFKNYGSFSSRQRTLVIGVIKGYSDDVSPYELFPDYEDEKTLRSVIGHLRSLKTPGEIDEHDIYHFFRVYPENMKNWIVNLNEGSSAFDNSDDSLKPHQIIDGILTLNKKKNSDKYKRQYWDKVAPCVHTRNDQLASQNTIHPEDPRVFSIRELMLMMSVPEDFKWVQFDNQKLNELTLMEKKEILKKEEIKIRQSLGEAVPTIIFDTISKKISNALDFPVIKNSMLRNIIVKYELEKFENLIKFLDVNPLNISTSNLRKIAELSNSKRTENAAYFTNKTLITEMMKEMPSFEKDFLRILEPAVGVGNFLPLILKKYEDKKIEIDVLDIDQNSLRITELILRKYCISDNVKINYICDDFLLHEFNEKYDLIIGNPPFSKLTRETLMIKKYKDKAINKETSNICSFFLDKALTISNYVSFVFPKFLLNTPEFEVSREYLSKKSIECIIDFGENGFHGVLIETIAVFINNQKRCKTTKIISLSKNLKLIQNKEYIFSNEFPYWIIYRNEFFDKVSEKLNFNVFKVFRDRQISNSMLSNKNEIKVIKSKNISDNGKDIVDNINYDSYISSEIAKKLSVYDYYKRDDVYLTPNMTYKPRVIRKPKNTIVNGSVAILIPKDNIIVSDSQLEYFSSNEYREFYQIARNYQTRSLNVDSSSVFFYGLLFTK